MLLNPEAVARREQIPNYSNFPVLRNPGRRQRLHNSVAFRRTVYEQGIWANNLQDTYGGARETSAEYFRYLQKRK